MDRREFVSSGVGALLAACALPAIVSAGSGKIEPSRTVMVRRVLPDCEEWNLRMFSTLRKGDVFRIYESSGERVMDGEHGTWIATGDAHKIYPKGQGGKWTWAVDTDRWSAAR